MNSLRPEELYSTEKLKSYLEQQGFKVAYKPGSNPPDIAMQVDSELWAVEHTSLHQYVEGDEGELPRIGWDERVRELGERISKRTRGKRKASWNLVIFGPYNKDFLTKVEERASEAILRDDPDYFRQWASPDVGFGMPLNEDVTLRRYEDADLTVQTASGFRPFTLLPGQGGQSAQVQARVDYAMDRILNDKKSKLLNIKAYDKLVLLIENRDFGAEADIARHSLESKAQLASFFNLIFFEDGDEITKVFG